MTAGKCESCAGARPKPANTVVLRHGARVAVCDECLLPTDLPSALVSREAFVVELDPTPEQETLFRKHCGLARYVYNWALDLRQKWWEANKVLPKDEREPEPNGQRLSKAWTQTHPEWSSELARSTVTYALDAVDDGYKGFFRRVKEGGGPAGHPRFKARGRCRDSFTIQDQSFRAEPRAIRLAKLGMVRTKQYVLPSPSTASVTRRRWVLKRDEHGREIREREIVTTSLANPGSTRYLVGRVLRLVVSLRAGRWFCSIMVERERPIEQPANADVVGIDMGTTNIVTTSDGEAIAPAPGIGRAQKRLRKLSRKLERAERGSKNRAEVVKQIATLHAHVADSRKNHLHAVANHLVDRYGVVVVEGYNVRELGRRDGPTRGQAGASKARGKIMQTGIGDLRRMLDYKAKWRGAKLVLVDDATDQTCSVCLHRNPHMRERRDLRFSCTACGHTGPRQRNTADLLARVGRGEVDPTSFGKGSPSESRHGQSDLMPRRSRHKPAKRASATTGSRRVETKAAAAGAKPARKPRL